MAQSVPPHGQMPCPWSGRTKSIPRCDLKYPVVSLGYNVAVEPISAQPVNLIGTLSQNPLLIVGALLIVALIGAAFYIIMTTPSRIKKRAAELSRNTDTISQQLNEAAKAGHFGSFTWDLKNPSASVWSEEMFYLCGLDTRDTPQSPNALLEHAYGPDQGAARISWAHVQSQPGPFEFTFLSAAPSGEKRNVRIKGETLPGADKRPALVRGIAHDITKEVEVERSKSEFISLAAHQLKTPLTTIKWYAEALQKGSVAELAPDQKTYVGNIYEASVRMMDMVNDFLNMSRIELGTLIMRPVDIDVCALAQSVIDEQMPAAKVKQLTLQLTCTPDVPHMQADTNLTRMVLQNLISNSIKYTPQGGTVECAITSGGASHETVSIRVSDTGMGIPKNEQGRVFERLHRASNAEKLVTDGTGLGLYIVKMIVDRVGGGISFESTEGKGTTFWVSLPVVSVVWDK